MRTLVALLALACTGCDELAETAGHGNAALPSVEGYLYAPSEAPANPHLPWAISAFEPGEGAGFGQSALPDIVTGWPVGGGEGIGGLDVLSLGKGGFIVLELPFGAIDGPGPDLIVFENAFTVAGSGGVIFQEPGRVSVSADGTEWRSFPCDASAPGPGCAGMTPVHGTSPDGGGALDPLTAGGDAFDLSDLGVSFARYVAIEDVGGKGGAGGTAGFDLDAVVVLHPGAAPVAP
jgi:hypothetical protein